MAVNWFSLNHKSNVWKLFLIQKGKKIFAWNRGSVVGSCSCFMLLHVQRVRYTIGQTLIYESFNLPLWFLVGLRLLSIVFLTYPSSDSARNISDLVGFVFTLVLILISQLPVLGVLRISGRDFIFFLFLITGQWSLTALISRIKHIKHNALVNSFLVQLLIHN